MARPRLRLIFQLFLKASALERKRAILTIAAIAWGTVAILLLLSFGQGLKNSLMKARRGMGNNLAIVWPGSTSKVWEGLAQGRAIHFRPEDVQFIREKIPGLVGVFGQMDHWNTTLTYGRKTQNAHVVGASASFGELRNQIPRPGGRFFNARDEAEKRRVIFLGDELAKDIFGATDPVGKKLLVDSTPYTVIGVLIHKLQMGTYSGPDAQAAVIPLSTYQEQFGEQHLNEMGFMVKKPQDMAGALAEYKEALSSRYRFDPTDDKALMVWNTVSSSKVMANITTGIEMFLGIVGVLTLLIGGIGVGNIMYAVVKERTREIGVKMAMGARAQWVTLPFILQGLLYTLFGGAVGMVIAIVIITLLSLIPTGGSRAMEFLGKPTLSLPIGLITVAILGVIGTLAGYFPARRASMVDPAETLRYE
ncbi:MAG: ABC transporter permease [Acidobacteriota bacterium]|jgi:putative ABC transport system permease protein